MQLKQTNFSNLNSNLTLRPEDESLNFQQSVERSLSPCDSMSETERIAINESATYSQRPTPKTKDSLKLNVRLCKLLKEK